MQLCSSSALAQPLAALARDQPREHVDSRDRRARAAVAHQAFEVDQRSRARRGCRRSRCSRQRRLERAEDRERPVAQRRALLVRHGEQVADDLDRDRAREVGDQVDLAPRARHGVEQAVDSADEARLHRRDVTRRQRAGDRLRTRVCSGGSLKTRLVVWCSKSGEAPYLGPNSSCLSELKVAGPGRRRRRRRSGVRKMLPSAMRLHRRVLAQGAVRRVRIVVEGVGQPLQVEIVGEGSVVGRHGHESTGWHRRLKVSESVASAGTCGATLAPSAAARRSPHGLRFRREIVIARPAAHVWDALADVGALHTRLVKGFVSDCRLEPGARIVTFANGMVARELIVDVDAGSRRIAWAVVGRRSAISTPAHRLSPKAKRPAASSGSPISCRRERDPVAGMIEAGLAAMKRTLEAASVG